MKVKTVNLGQILCTKDPAHVEEVIGEKNEHRLGFGLSDYKVAQDVQIIVSMQLSFHDQGDVEIAKYGCYVVVNVSLSDDEIKLGDQMETEINYFAVTQAWSVFESHLSLLRDFNIDFSQLPPPPKKEEIEEFIKAAAQ